MTRRNARLAVAAATAVLTATPVVAQVSLTPRALGMGGAYVAAARGNQTLFLNPANLGLSGNPHWSIAFPQVALGGTMLGPGFGDLRDIANYDDADQARLDEILATIPAGGTEIRYDFRAPLAAIQTGRFAVGVSYGSIGHHTMGRDLVELLFKGYEDGRTDYSVGDTRGSRVTFWDVAAGFGHRIGPVSFGVTGHYIRGGTVLNSRLFEPRIDVDAGDIEVDFRSVYAKGGQGYGVDFGAAVQPIPSVTVSAAVSNAFSKMEWSEELHTRFLTLSREDFDHGDAMYMMDRYRYSEEEVAQDAAPLSVVETMRGLYDEAYFPTVLRAGAAWEGRTGTTLSASYQNRLTDGRLGDAWETQTGVGVQQKLPLVTVRGGYATDLDGSTLLSGGLTLGVIEVGVARIDEGSLAGAERSGWIGTFGIGVRTRGEMK